MHSTGSTSVKLACGHEIPMISVAATDCHKMPVRKGLVGDKLVQVLRDTGCSTVVVKRDLVKQNDLTGRTRKCILLDGTIRAVPEAVVHVDTPFYVGKLVALCMDDLLYGLVIGNVEGVRNPWDPDTDWKPPSRQDSPALAVETRGQLAKKEKALKPLKT